MLKDNREFTQDMFHDSLIIYHILSEHMERYPNKLLPESKHIIYKSYLKTVKPTNFLENIREFILYKGLDSRDYTVIDSSLSKFSSTDLDILKAVYKLLCLYSNIEGALTLKKRVKIIKHVRTLVELVIVVFLIIGLFIRSTSFNTLSVWVCLVSFILFFLTVLYTTRANKFIFKLISPVAEIRIPRMVRELKEEIYG